MKKRSISKRNYRLLETELNFMEHEGELSKGQKDSSLSLYEVTNGLNFIRVLLTFGAFLMGIGVLSFIASNWGSMGTLVKFFLIIVSIIGVNLIGFKLEENQPKTARTMHYLGVLFFGAGIFLVGQMFHLGGEYYQAFLMWSIGIIPIGYVLKDKIILVFSVVLLGIYSFGYFTTDLFSLPYLVLLLIPILYWISSRFGDSVVLTFLLNGLSIQFFVMFLIKTTEFVDSDSFLIQLIPLFIFGIVMMYIPVKEKLKGVFRFQGHLVHGIVGLMLTFPAFWEMTVYPDALSIVFAIIYFLFILFLIQRGSLFSILILSALIFRFYIDLSLDFMPKSMVFIIGGAILIAFGYLFEKRRRKGGVSGE